MLLSRFTGKILSFIFVLLLVSCGGGGGSDEVSVSASASSLSFTQEQYGKSSSQSINLELTNANGTVYAKALSDSPVIASAVFNLTGSTKAVITVQPTSALSVGRYTTTVRLSVYSDSAGTKLLASYSYPVYVNVTPESAFVSTPNSISVTVASGTSKTASVSVSIPTNVFQVSNVSPSNGPISGVTVVKSGTNPIKLDVLFSPGTSAPASYSMTLDITANTYGGSQRQFKIPVSYTITP